METTGEARPPAPTARSGRHALTAALVAFALLAPGLGERANAEPAKPQALDDAAKALKDAEAAIEAERAASAALADQAAVHQGVLDAMRLESIRLAAEARAIGQTIDELEARLGALFAEKMRLATALDARRAARGDTFGAMLQLSRRQPQALLLSSASVVEATRSALLLGAVSRALEADAAALLAGLKQVAVVRSEIAAERQRLDEANRALADRRVALESLMAERAKLEQEADDARALSQERLERLVRESRDLEELVAQLEAARLRAAAPIPPPPAKPVLLVAESLRPDEIEPAAGPEPAAPVRSAALDAEAQRAAADPRPGNFGMPTEGRIVSQFGSPSAPGVTAKGLAIAAQPLAVVVAPFAGKVVFAGPFHDYGQLLIIAHGEGYHTLLAGLGRIDSAVGRWVLAGEPVGIMGSSTEARLQLYLELRHHGRPVNPLPWLATGSSKLSG
jgi:septal ring factor EnvC (AmiA/AmiB activator)